MSKQKTDYNKFFKPCMIAVGIILVIATLITCIFGFNKSIDFVGGTQLVVNFDYAKPDLDIEKTEDFNKASNTITTIIDNHHARIQSFQVQGDYGTKSFVINLLIKDEETVNSIRVDINKELNKSATFATMVAGGEEDTIIGNPVDMTLKTSTIDGFISSHAMLLTIASVIFALTLLMFYSFFRIRMAGGLSMLFGSALDVLLTLSFVSLARIQISTYIFVGMAVISFVSVYASASLLFKIKELSKEPKYSSYTNYDLANLAVDLEWKKNLVIYVLSFIMVVIIGALLASNVLHLCLSILAGIVAVLATHTFIIPAFWANINKTREKPVSIQVEENKEDKSAEVIEIKE